MLQQHHPELKEGLRLQELVSAPLACIAKQSAAVSFVTCEHVASLKPLKGCSIANLF